MKRVLALLLMVCILCAGWVAASAASLPAPFFVPFSPRDGLFIGMPKEEALALVEAEGWQFDYAYNSNHYYYYNVTVDQYTVPKCSLFFSTMDNDEKFLRDVEYMFTLSYGNDISPDFVALFNDLEQSLIALYGAPTKKNPDNYSVSFRPENMDIMLKIFPEFTYDGKPYHTLSLFLYVDWDSLFLRTSPPATSPNTSGF